MSEANCVVRKRGCQNGEGKAGGTIYPGDLIKLKSDDTFVVHPVAAGPCQKRFALENELYGKGLTDAYASGDRVPYFIAYRGDVINARLKISENIHIGDPLISAGDGTLKLALDVSAPSAVEYPELIVGWAREASFVASVARIDVEIA
jgi:hypothetical protein